MYTKTTCDLISNYKIISMLLAKCPPKTLRTVISADQPGYLKDSSIGNISNLLDVVEFTHPFNIQCIVISLCFENALNVIQ